MRRHSLLFRHERVGIQLDFADGQIQHKLHALVLVAAVAQGRIALVGQECGVDFLCEGDDAGVLVLETLLIEYQVLVVNLPPFDVAFIEAVLAT